MKVIKNNYDESDIYLKELVCEKCKSELQYDESDIHIGVFGNGHITCPLCKHENMLDEDDYHIVLTKDNVEFPSHYWHTSAETGAVDVFNNETLKDEINRAINYFRNNKDEDSWFTQRGNLSLHAYRFDGDEEYVFVATNDYYEVNIPFEKADYK